ncbi:hypothetical protein FNF29_01435 [Cafeteria roenbergensis]|uniref:Uncharacterized protein n=2 Tax=Cafeteria roenbergensis TaxID=33653 RepID=A0A5A8DEA6_CAFRO|nr:hypothetical protein FNF29_01435 [Cafeteria roenbergensis]KAA0163588.1 hypothetical protein FNF31_02750 [Cafeteria roenbergensis]|eukprot:KAA0156017.1 hypothetical protein FNF29_01435 [Cafeteria roenbergensis]
MPASLSARGRQRARVMVRKLMRQARRVDCAETPKPWMAAIAESARATAAEATTKAELRSAMAGAADVLACFTAVQEQSKLLERYHGGDVDSKDYRARAAARVGLAVPEGVPLGARDLGSKYDISGATIKAEGVEGMKQELYAGRRAKSPRPAADLDEMRP